MGGGGGGGGYPKIMQHIQPKIFQLRGGVIPLAEDVRQSVFKRRPELPTK